ncbi:alkaline phosphatase family protein, partial [Pseudomonas neuropathica]
GMTTIEEARTFDFDLMTDLQRGVASICGDIRARHVYLQDPTDADVVKRWRDILAGHSVLTREQALVLGLFGKNMTDAACRRIGDLLLIAGDNAG